MPLSLRRPSRAVECGHASLLSIPARHAVSHYHNSVPLLGDHLHPRSDDKDQPLTARGMKSVGNEEDLISRADEGGRGNRGFFGADSGEAYPNAPHPRPLPEGLARALLARAFEHG
jgi:hypothetical protein